MVPTLYDPGRSAISLLSSSAIELNAIPIFIVQSSPGSSSSRRLTTLMRPSQPKTASTIVANDPQVRPGQRRCCCNTWRATSTAYIRIFTATSYSRHRFVLTEQRPRMQSRPEVVPLRQGDAVAFAVRSRPVKGTKGNYRVNLRHGVSRIQSGLRHTIGIIFHDAGWSVVRCAPSRRGIMLGNGGL
jgi:hypothetical protein